MSDERPDTLARGPILLCAGTEPAAAARLAKAVTSLLTDRPVVVLATWEPPQLHTRLDATLDALFDIHGELRAAAHHAATETADAASTVLEAQGVHVTTTVLPNEQAPWRTIIDLADDLDASAIVAGITERATVHDGSLGSQARALAHRAHSPLLLLPADTLEADAGASALFAYDGSDPAAHAVRTAAKLLRPRPAVVATAWHDASSVVNLALIAVPDEIVRKGTRALDDTARSKAGEHAAAGAALLTEAGWSSDSIALHAMRDVPTEIIAAADEHAAAIIVTGTRGRSHLAAALLGSTAEGILRLARRPVLLVPPRHDT